MVSYLSLTYHSSLVASLLHITHFQALRSPRLSYIADKPGQLIGLVDVAHSSDLCSCCFKTGYAFLLNFGIVSYWSKTKSAAAASSMEAEFLSAVTAAKHAKYLCAVLLQMGYPQKRSHSAL